MTSIKLKWIKIKFNFLIEKEMSDKKYTVILNGKKVLTVDNITSCIKLITQPLENSCIRWDDYFSNNSAKIIIDDTDQVIWKSRSVYNHCSGDNLNFCPLGLYEIFWKSGGSSLAAIGNMKNGIRWIAPTNWTSDNNPTITMDKIADSIEYMTIIIKHQ